MAAVGAAVARRASNVSGVSDTLSPPGARRPSTAVPTGSPALTGALTSPAAGGAGSAGPAARRISSLARAGGTSVRNLGTSPAGSASAASSAATDARRLSVAGSGVKSAAIYRDFSGVDSDNESSKGDVADTKAIRDSAARRAKNLARIGRKRSSSSSSSGNSSSSSSASNSSDEEEEGRKSRDKRPTGWRAGSYTGTSPAARRLSALAPAASTRRLSSAGSAPGLHTAQVPAASPTHAMLAAMSGGVRPSTRNLLLSGAPGSSSSFTSPQQQARLPSTQQSSVTPKGSAFAGAGGKRSSVSSTGSFADPSTRRASGLQGLQGVGTVPAGMPASLPQLAASTSMSSTGSGGSHPAGGSLGNAKAGGSFVGSPPAVQAMARSASGATAQPREGEHEQYQQQRRASSRVMYPGEGSAHVRTVSARNLQAGAESFGSPGQAVATVPVGGYSAGAAAVSPDEPRRVSARNLMPGSAGAGADRRVSARNLVAEQDPAQPRRVSQRSLVGVPVVTAAVPSVQPLPSPVPGFVPNRGIGALSIPSGPYTVEAGLAPLPVTGLPQTASGSRRSMRQLQAASVSQPRSPVPSTSLQAGPGGPGRAPGPAGEEHAGLHPLSAQIPQAIVAPAPSAHVHVLPDGRQLRQGVYLVPPTSGRRRSQAVLSVHGGTAPPEFIVVPMSTADGFTVAAIAGKDGVPIAVALDAEGRVCLDKDGVPIPLDEHGQPVPLGTDGRILKPLVPVPIFTMLMVAGCLAGFALSLYATGPGVIAPISENPTVGPSIAALVACGAKVRYLISGPAQEWWRLASPMWLHSGLVHLLPNMMLLWRYGSALEMTAGTLKFALLYLASGLFSIVASTAFAPGAMTVGASGAIFGIFGAFLAELTQNWHLIPTSKERCMAFASLFFSLALNGAIGLLPFIDNFAHIGGLIAGVLLGFPLLVYRQKPAPTGGQKPAKRVACTPCQWTLGIVGVLLYVSLLGLGLLTVALKWDAASLCPQCSLLDCVPINNWWTCPNLTGEVPGYGPAVNRTNTAGGRS